MKAHKLLWIDCCGGLLVGILTIAASQFLAQWENLSIKLILFMGIANLVYGGYSLSLALGRNRSRPAINLLALANMAWLPVCITMVILNFSEIYALGLLHLLGEGLFVGALGLLEWKVRDQLVSDQSRNL